jgi:plastocyanin
MKLLWIMSITIAGGLSLAETIDHRALAIPLYHPASLKAAPPRSGTTIKAIVKFQGSVDLHRKSFPPLTPHCTKKAIDESLLVDPDSRGIKDVIVYLDHVEVPVRVDPNHHIVIGNKDCAFQSRVGTLSIGQQVKVTNHDPIMHNVHIRNGNRTVLNVALAPGNQPILKEIHNPGVLLMQCAIHDFMKGFIGVFPHPYHGQTNVIGEFLIEEVPAGEYELKIWHEVLGNLQKTIIVAEGEPSIEVNFDYAPPTLESREPVILPQ